VSTSSEDRISDTSTSGLVEPVPSVDPAGRRPALLVPGSSDRYMSFSGVRGRSSTVALRYTRWAYCLSMFICTTALPSRSVIDPILPTCTPAIVIGCPCPEVTAAASENSALIV